MDIQVAIKQAWEQVSQQFLTRLALSIQELDDIISIEGQQSETVQQDRLQKSLGDFGSLHIDLGSITKVVQDKKHSGRDPQSLTRLEFCRQNLLDWKNNHQKLVPAPLFLTFSDNESAIAQATQHLNTMAQCFKFMRMASLEIHGKYEAEFHDDFFAEFNWEHLNNDEIALCPPCVVELQSYQQKYALYTAALPLLTSGLPFKVVYLNEDFSSNTSGSGRSAALRSAFEVETLPVALNNILVLQDSTVRPVIDEKILAALQSPRPALLSLLHSPEKERSRTAILGRALPIFVYDPDASRVLNQRFDLSANPDWHSPWAQNHLEYINANGKKDRLEFAYTFADFAQSQSKFSGEFSLATEAQQARLVHIAPYLEMSPAVRTNKAPYVYALKSDGTLAQMIPSMAVVAQTAQRLQLWNALCEIAGVRNPHFQSIAEQVREEMHREYGEKLNQMQLQHAQELEEARGAAVQQALANIAQKLVSGQSLDLPAAGSATSVATSAAPVATPSVATPAPSSTAPEVTDEIEESDEPWIDTPLCSSCDECITIDPNIFAYDENKQAYIKDPHGGPHKNIVKAAKKCAAKIIYPGKG